MSDALRGFVLLLSVVLWLPVLRPLLDGEMRTDEAVLRYGAALLFAWGGVSALAALVRAYTAPEPEASAEEATAAAPARSSAQPATAAAATAAASGDPDSDLMPDGTPRRRADDRVR